jgi:hypothetical protein
MPQRELADAIAYYSGYATQDDMEWIGIFDVDVLVRGFFLFLNSNDSWVPSYRPRMVECQRAGRLFLVGMQAAVLVEDARNLTQLGGDDAALDFPMDTITHWEEYACRTPEGLTLMDVLHQGFAHSCINNQSFREFFKQRLRLLIDSGADGVHIDELPTRYFTRREGYCEACMQGFRDYLADKYSPSQLASVYGINDVSSFDFRSRLAEEGFLQSPPESPLHREWWLSQLSMLVEAEREILDYCRSYAQGLGKSFVITSNSYEPELNPDRTIEMTMTDFCSIGTGLTIDLRRNGTLVSELRIPPSYSYIPLYRMAAAVTPDKPVTLFIDGPGGTGTIAALSQQKQKDVVRWMFAEACAAGAHFHIPYPSLDFYGPLEECQSYVQFIQANRDLYQGMEHLADVGILFSFASEVWDFWVQPSSAEPIHNRQWYGLAQALTDMSIQYDAIFAADGRLIPNQLTVDGLLRYPTLIVPWAYALSDEHAQLLEGYARGGGRLIIAGDLATFDEEKNPRQALASANLAELGAIVIAELDFEAYLNNPQGAGAIREQLAGLIPNKLVSVTGGAVAAQLCAARSALHIHLINRELGDVGFTPQRDLSVTITLPPRFSIAAANATYLSPDLPAGEATLLPLAQQGNSLQVTVPDLAVYGVLTIGGD